MMVTEMDGFRGGPLARLDQAGERFSREVLPGVLRAQAMERIGRHKAQGDVVVASALDVSLQHCCRQHDGVNLTRGR